MSWEDKVVFISVICTAILVTLATYIINYLVS